MSYNGPSLAIDNYRLHMNHATIDNYVSIIDN